MCPKHGVETRLRCANCGKPICIRCQVRTEVGLKCEECAALPARAVVRQRRLNSGVLLIGGALILVGAIAVALAGPLSMGKPAAPAAIAPVGNWHAVADLATIRGSTTAVVLKDGRALVMGGGVGSIPLAAVEIYDPAQGRWSAGASLHQARRGHVALLMQDGRVLVAGGVAAGRVLAAVEVYDPAANRWTTVAPMTTARLSPTVALLGDGRVLVAGGGSRFEGPGGFRPDPSAEVFDPKSATWSSVTGGMLDARYVAASAVLADGRVLIVGGQGTGEVALATAELYDPAVGRFVRTGSLAQPRQEATASLLADGQVLLAGGSNGNSSLGSAEIFDPNRGTWRSTGPMSQARRLQAASRLSNGWVLVTGGESLQGGSRSSLKTAELYDPGRRRWVPAAMMGCPRSAQVQVALGDTVLVVGGDAAFPGEPPRAQSCAEIFSLTS
ncbi:MAG: hypothetical protein NVS1B3_03000 [Candidatus Dormibacteraceae bacterium]